MGYLKQTIKGFSWVGAFRVASRIVSFLRMIILARILIPAQFGIFGIVSLVLSFLDILTEMGITFVLVKEKNLDEEYINTAWMVSVVRGIAISLFIFLTAPLIADFFHAPQVRSLLALSSIIPLIRGLINPAVAKFQKELKFDKEFRLKFSVFFIDSLVAVILTIITRSAIGLVWGLIAGAIFEVLFSFVFVKPTPKFSFNIDRFRKIIGQGKWITALGVLNYFFSQGDNIVVGKVLNSESLGLYQMAYKMSILPITEIADVVSRVTFPVYVKIADDIARIKKAFWKTTFGISLLAVPFGLIIFIFSKEIVEIILGKNWLGIIPVLKILSIFGIIKAVSGPTLVLFLSLGKQKYVTAATFFSLVFMLLTIFPLTLKYGIVGTGCSVLIASVLEVPIIVFYLIKVFRQEKA